MLSTTPPPLQSRRPLNPAAKMETKNNELKREGEQFSYEFCSNGTRYSLTVPVPGVLGSSRARELASRLVRAHNLPCYLEEELTSQLEEFARDSASRRWDTEGDKAIKLAGNSVTEEGSKVAKRIQDLAEQYTNNCSEFSVATVTHDEGPTFSDMYHSLIHSPALDTLLQLEHTYALAMENSLQAWKNARENMAKRHEKELREKMAAVSSLQATEAELGAVTREHERDRAVLEAQWRGELTQLRETQRRTYHQWIEGAYKEMTSSGSAKSSQFVQSRRGGGLEDGEVFSDPGEEGEEALPSSEESFTIHLGAQLKSAHNIRLLCGHPLSLCRQRRAGSSGGGVLSNPERLQTAMSLYSTKLACMILMVDTCLDGGIEQKFSEICHQSTDLHFPDYLEQISVVMETLARVSEPRSSGGGGLQLESSSSSQTSETSTPRAGSPFNPNTTERSPRGMLNDSSDSAHFLSPPPVTTPMSATPTSRRSPGGSFMDPGDFFITRHSNLSQVHVVLHLATDRDAVRDQGLRARHPVMMGLKNCLHVAARNDVHHITVPLLLVHSMEPEMTIQWCLRRAELVFKCVKGFMLENPLWGNGDSRTIQFLIPQSVSQDLFEEICDMVPKIFRVSTARKLTSKPRTHSYK